MNAANASAHTLDDRVLVVVGCQAQAGDSTRTPVYIEMPEAVARYLRSDLTVALDALDALAARRGAFA